MRRSVIAMALLAAILGAPACAARKPPTVPKPPPVLARTATLNVTTGITIAAQAPLPHGFVLLDSFAPMWLQNGTEIGVTGVIDGRTDVIGFSGPGLQIHRVIAADFGPGAPGGKILDMAASPNGMTLATAVAEPTQKRLEVYLRDLITNGNGYSAASFDGEFEVLGLHWLDPETIAIALRPTATASALANAAPGATATGEGGLYVIKVAGEVSVRQLKIDCALSRLSWSAGGRYAVGQGDAAISPTILDLAVARCAAFNIPRGPIRVLSWASRGSSFAYAVAPKDGRGAGVFRYDISTGQGALVAISSSAAAFASNGAILALGNQTLTWRRVIEEPDAPVTAEMALFDPSQPEVRVKSLAIRTLPRMLAESTMVYSTASDAAAIEMFVPGIAGPLRDILAYSAPAQVAFLLAEGPARGSAAMSWSPDGERLALADGDSLAAMLTVLIPPRTAAAQSTGTAGSISATPQ